MEEKAQQMALEAEAKAKVTADLQREVCLCVFVFQGCSLSRLLIAGVGQAEA